MNVYYGHMSILQSLARDVGVSERTLRRAIDQGTVRAVRPTPRTLTLPVAEHRYVRRSWGIFSRLRRALRTESNVRFAMLFGSRARGTDEPESDVDLLVVLRDQSLDRVVDLTEKLTKAVGLQVDLTRLDDAESEPGLLADWIGEGRVVVDRDRLWPQLLDRRQALRQLGRRGERNRTEAALGGIDSLLQR